MTKEKKQTGIFPAALAAAAVLAALCSLGLVLADGAYRDLGAGLLSVTVAAFVADLLILLALKRRTVIAGIVKFWAILLVNCLLFIPAGIWWFGPVAIFHPNRDAAAEEMLSVRADVFADVSEADGLYGWRYRCGTANAPVILCFYGNGETASRKMVEFCEYVSKGYFPGCDIAVYDYPGYGSAPGRPTEASVTAMGLAACDRLQQEGRIVYVFGYSVGTGVANCVAANREIGSLVLMAPYADGYDLFDNFIPVFRSDLTRRMISFKMESSAWAAKVKAAPLLLASRSDRTVPFESSQRLSACYVQAELREVDVADHAGFWSSSECLQAASDHFREATVS